MSQDTPLPFRAALPWTAFVAVLFLLNYMSRSTLTPLLVALETDLGVGHSQATSLLLMQSAGFCLALAICGFLLSRIRPRNMLVLSLLIPGCALLTMPLVTSLNETRMVFLVFGIGAGVYFPAGIATLSSLVYPKDWGKAVAVHELAPNTGFILIPLLAQAALLFTDWRGTFAGMGVLMICTSMVFFVWGRGGYAYATPPSFRGCRELIRNPASWVVVLLLTVSMVGEFSIFSILQLFLVNEVDFAPDKANLMLSLSRLATPVAVILGGWAADRFNAWRIIRVCFAFHAVALCLMALNPADERTFVLIGVLLQALSIAFLFPAIFKAFAACYAVDQQPLLISLSMPIAGLISAGGVPLFLGYCGEYLTFGVGFLVIAVLSILSILSVSFLKPRKAIN